MSYYGNNKSKQNDENIIKDNIDKKSNMLYHSNGKYKDNIKIKPNMSYYGNNKSKHGDDNIIIDNMIRKSNMSYYGDFINKPGNIKKNIIYKENVSSNLESTTIPSDPIIESINTSVGSTKVTRDSKEESANLPVSDNDTTNDFSTTTTNPITNTTAISVSTIDSNITTREIPQVDRIIITRNYLKYQKQLSNEEFMEYQKNVFYENIERIKCKNAICKSTSFNNAGIGGKATKNSVQRTQIVCLLCKTKEMLHLALRRTAPEVAETLDRIYKNLNPSSSLIPTLNTKKITGFFKPV
jgi:hypothetical protein